MKGLNARLYPQLIDVYLATTGTVPQGQAIYDALTTQHSDMARPMPIGALLGRYVTTDVDDWLDSTGEVLTVLDSPPPACEVNRKAIIGEVLFAIARGYLKQGKFADFFLVSGASTPPHDIIDISSLPSEEVSHL